jgi:outer membrane lipoprotein-sorting protein
MSKSVSRWIPAVVATALIATATVAIPLNANAVSPLASKTPQQVLQLALNSSVRSLSGTVEQTSNLGIPSLSNVGAAGAASHGSQSSVESALSLLTGTYSARVYLDGDTKARVQVMDKLAERDVIRNGADVWAYDSKTNNAVHTTVPATTGEKKSSPHTTMTPASLAKLFLDKASSSTTVTIGDDVKVAGRSAYDLVLTPKTSATLVGSVSIAVDSATGLPLSVTVDARGQKDAAFSTKFTDLTIGAPAASLFTFTPPKGATVKQEVLPAPTKRVGPLTQEVPGDVSKPVISGTGWASVAEIATGTQLAKLTSNPLFTQLTTAVTGGHLAHTALVNILFTTDGRVFAGSVPASALEAAAIK